MADLTIKTLTEWAHSRGLPLDTYLHIEIVRTNQADLMNPGIYLIERDGHACLHIKLEDQKLKEVK